MKLVKGGSCAACHCASAVTGGLSGCMLISSAVHETTLPTHGHKGIFADNSVITADSNKGGHQEYKQTPSITSGCGHH